jgi:hypothetical protein
VHSPSYLSFVTQRPRSCYQDKNKHFGSQSSLSLVRSIPRLPSSLVTHLCRMRGVTLCDAACVGQTRSRTLPTGVLLQSLLSELPLMSPVMEIDHLTTFPTSPPAEAGPPSPRARSGLRACYTTLLYHPERRLLSIDHVASLEIKTLVQYSVRQYFIIMLLMRRPLSVSVSVKRCPFHATTLRTSTS